MLYNYTSIKDIGMLIIFLKNSIEITINKKIISHSGFNSLFVIKRSKEQPNRLNVSSLTQSSPN